MYKFSRWDIQNAGAPLGDPFGGPAFRKYQDPVTATIAGGAALAGGLMQADASKSAASQQANAANNATQTQLQMFNTVNNQNAPYRQAGTNALNSLQYGFGANPVQQAPQIDWNAYLAANPDVAAAGFDPQSHYNQYGKAEGRQISYLPAQPGPQTSGISQGQFTHQFDANDLQTNLAPNYQFQLDQGLGATKNAGNLQSGLISGNTLKGVNDYAQNYAGNAYQNAFNNYNTNQSNIFNRLSNIAGLGSGANQITANAGTTTAGNVGNAQMASGAAQAAGTVGSANALSGGVQNAASWYALPSILKMGSSGAGAE